MIIVLDIDGTLANNDHRAHHVDREEGDKRPKDWNGFLKPHLVAEDVLIEGAQRAMEHFQLLNYKIMFLTGRNESIRAVTTEWIFKHLGITVDDDTLVMRGAGNMIALRHPQGIRTTYLHLHRFASGMRPGRAVRQGQTIGYVGSTGLATGPHLHYGITVNSRHIDPLRYQPAKGTSLPPAERKRFLNQLPKRQRQLASASAK